VKNWEEEEKMTKKKNEITPVAEEIATVEPVVDMAEEPIEVSEPVDVAEEVVDETLPEPEEALPEPILEAEPVPLETLHDNIYLIESSTAEPFRCESEQVDLAVKNLRRHLSIDETIVVKRLS